MDDIKAMKVLLLATQTGSMSAAGRRIGTSPASVSRQITALEDDLGVRLLNRTSRRLSLTQEGEVYVQRAERLIQDLEEMRVEVTQLNARPYGTLRVQSRISLGTQYLSPLLPELLSRYPELKVELRLADADLDLVEHNIDVAIRTGGLSDSSLIVRRIGDNPRVICASPAYWEKHPAPNQPEDLSQHNCLTFISEPSPSVWQFRGQDGETIQFRPTGNLQTNNAEALRHAAVSGLGVALLPSWSIHEELKTGKLQSVLGDFERTATDFDTGIYAVYHSKRHLSVKTRLFIDHLIAGFQKMDSAHES